MNVLSNVPPINKWNQYITNLFFPWSSLPSVLLFYLHLPKVLSSSINTVRRNFCVFLSTTSVLSLRVPHVGRIALLPRFYTLWCLVPRRIKTTQTVPRRYSPGCHDVGSHGSSFYLSLRAEFLSRKGMRWDSVPRTDSKGVKGQPS